MRSSAWLPLGIMAAALCALPPPASADTASAYCEVRKDGETKQGRSGPCDFSQRQGYVSIDLRNGESWELSPADKPQHFRDQKGNRVVRTASGNGHEYKWDNKKIIVTFGGNGASHGSSAGDNSQHVPALADLVGAEKGHGGYQMQRRNYAFIRESRQGNNVKEYWQEQENGQCVEVNVFDNRYTSLKFAQPADCRGGGGGGMAHSTGMRDGSDDFDTVCGVIVNGQNYRYRCQVTDHYAGGQKVRTTLRMPDQTIELTWKPGNRVGLQFEGMVPKESRYASAEGEINWVFEDKTYFYIANKDMARMEVRDLRN